MLTAPPLFDLSFLEQMNDTNFIKEVIGLYVHDTAVDLQAMQSACENGELETVYKIAHKLKSSTGMLQAHVLLSQLEQVSEMAKTEGNESRLLLLIQMALYEFEDLKVGLESHLQTLLAAAC